MGVLQPFTVEHFTAWAGGLLLESGDPWVLEPFQVEFIADVFAGYRECWLIVPEGNGKTTLLAGLGLYGLRFASEPSIPITASTMDQAKILYKQAKGFIRRGRLETPDAEGLWFEAYDGWRRIDLRQTTEKTKRGITRGVMEVHGADSGRGDGVIPYPFAFLDELHRHKNLDLYEVWRGKLDKRGAQLITISTAGAPGSDFEETRTVIRGSGRRTARGRTFTRVEDAGLVFHEHAVPADGDVGDLELVAEANPFSGVTVDRLARKRASVTMSDSHWKRFTCNIAATTDSDPFIEGSAWLALADGAGIPEGARVTLGADGSRTWDTTVVAAAAMAEDGRLDVEARVFSVVEEHPHHVLHSGGKIDFDDVENYLLDLFGRFHPLETAYDPRYLERSMEIVDRRLPSVSIHPVEPFSKNMRDALQAFYTAVAEGVIRHQGDPVIAAHLANTKVERDPRNKEIRRIGKIDPKHPIDAVPALALAVWRVGFARPSVYEDRGVLTV